MAFAQPVVQAVPAPPAGATLNAALGRLARDPRDLAALIDAGHAALQMGDVDAAVGFFARADQLSPNNMRVKAGLAGALVRSDNPYDAISLFAEAERAGAVDPVLAVDRGLAYDLVGDNASAQRYYRQALSAEQSDEAMRRLALSLAIAGDRKGMETTLSPLLQRQDKAAWRARAFALAILGAPEEAVAIANQTMPADLANGIAPYLRFMPRLTPAQQAAAANLGRFPRAADIGRDDPRVAAYAPARRVAGTIGSALVPAGEPLGRGRSRGADRSGQVPALARAAPPDIAPTRSDLPAPATAPVSAPASAAARDAAPQTATHAAATRTSAPAVARASAPAPMPAPMPVPAPVPAPVPVATSPSVATPAVALVPAAAPGAPSPAPAAGRGTGTFDLGRMGPPAPQPQSQSQPPLQSSAPAPAPAPAAAVIAAPAPAPAAAAPPAVPNAAAPSPRPRRLADAFADLAAVPRGSAAPAPGAVDVRKLAEARARAAEAAKVPPKPAHPSRIWVQVGTGRDTGALGFTWRGLAKENPVLFKGQSASISDWGRTNRLLAGPFASEAAAQAFLGKAKKAGVDAFVWASPAGQVVDALALR